MPFDPPREDRLPDDEGLFPAFPGENVPWPAAQMTSPREQVGLGEEEFLRTLVELAPDPSVVVDREGQITFANQHLAALFGYTRKDLLGQPVEFLIPERFHVAHRHHRADYAAAPHPRPMGANLRLFGRRRDGSEFPILVSLTPLSAFGQGARGRIDQGAGAGAGRGLAGVLASIHDITERVRLETTQAATEATNAELGALLTVTDTALSYLGLTELLDQLLTRVMSGMGVDNMAILLLDEDGQTLTLRAARGLEEALVGRTRIPVGHGFVGRIAASREPLVADDLSRFDIVNPFLREQLRAVVGVPLVVEDRLLGIVHVGSATPRHFTDADVRLLQRVADRIALAIRWAGLYAAEQDARVRAEAALARAIVGEAQAAERADRLETVLETMVDGVAVFDRDSHITQTNRAFRDLLATDRVPAFDTLSALERAALFVARDPAGKPLAPDQFPLVRALQGETVTGASADCRLKALDGRELDTNSSAVPLHDRTGAIAGAVIVVRDITWRRHLQREREEARAHALAVREVNRALEEFLATAAHDLRNPLGAVLGFLELAVRQVQRLAAAVRSTTPSDTSSSATATAADASAEIARRVEAVQARLEDAHQSGARMARLMNVLFDTAALRAAGKPLQLHPAPCDLAALVRDQVAELHGSAPERTVQVRIVGNQPIMVNADGERVRQVLANYLTNALKYAPPERPIEVCLENCCAGDATQVRVAVRDEGPGLPKGEQARVWKMFYRAPGVVLQSGAVESLGLGLHICKTIIEAHRGHVGVESAVGHGSTFWFTLPVLTPPSIQTTATS